ncbi:MAG: hypothetical protein ABI615_09330 [Chthoniobacterales bacterium]
MPRKKTLPRGAGISEEHYNGTNFFRARLSAAFLGDGSKKKAFPKRAQAEEWIFEQLEDLKKRKAAEPEAVTHGLSVETLSEVRLALALLAGRSGILKAVEAWVAKLDAPTDGKTMTEAIAALKAEQQAEQLGDRHVRDTESKLKLYWGGYTEKKVNPQTGKVVETVFEGFLDKRVVEIVPADVTKMLAKPTGKDGEEGPPSLALRVKRKRYSRILINYCIDQQWIRADTNPLGTVRRKKRIVTDINKAELYILSPLEVARLLWSAQQNCPDALGGLALKLFSGMRNPEMVSVRWGAILDGSVFLKAAFVKTRRTRPVDIEPVLGDWLKFVGGSKGSGELVFKAFPNRNDRQAAWQLALRQIADGAGFGPGDWPMNAMRHCFSSFHVALYKDTALTAAETGNSEAVVKANYLNAVRPSDCKQFWRLFPAVAEALATSPAKQDAAPEKPEHPEAEPED